MILLTGATGFVGSHLLNKISKIDKVRCLVRYERQAEELKKKGYETFIGDILENKRLLEATRGVDIVIHSAALMRGTRKQYELVNVIGTKNVVEACKKENVKQIIYLSSVLADEDYDNGYGKTKRKGEDIVKNSGICYVILRLDVVYGKNDKRTVGKIANAIKKSPVLMLFGKGRVNTHFLHIENATDAITAALKNTKAKNKTYCLAGEKIDYDELVRIFADKTKKRKMVLYAPFPLLKFLFYIYKHTIEPYVKLPLHFDTLFISKDFDTSKAKKDLGFRPSTKDTLISAIN